jgi:hypothetical protein
MEKLMIDRRELPIIEDLTCNNRLSEREWLMRRVTWNMLNKRLEAESLVLADMKISRERRIK